MLQWQPIVVIRCNRCIVGIIVMCNCCLFDQATKAHIKLNTKKLYQADWHSVKELLKVTSVLYDAIKTNSSSNYDNADDDIAAVTFDVSAKVSDPTVEMLSNLRCPLTSGVWHWAVAVGIGQWRMTLGSGLWHWVVVYDIGQ